MKHTASESLFAPARVDVERRADGTLVLTSPTPLGPYESSVGAMLQRGAKDWPDRVLLAERDAEGGWRKLSFAEAWRQSRSIAQGLLDRGLGPQRPVMILSGNSIDHALLMLGGFVAGVPVAPVSVAYSLMSQDLAKLKHILALVQPGLVYAGNGQMFAKAIASLPADLELVVSAAPPEGRKATSFADLVATKPTQAVDGAFTKVGPDTVAKYLFTSGSTGLPKAVINTHRMMCANQQMIAQVWPFVKETPPVLLDWMPWNHTFGGNHDINLVICRGGTMHIDGGRPLPGLIEQTVANLREVSPTIYLNVPAGYNMLLPYLERDAELARSFFRRLQIIFYAGAALPQDLWDRLINLSMKTVGHVVTMTSSWGSTETAPMATAAHFPLDRSGVIGIPVPGVTLKMTPSGGKMELRVKGPNVTPGYLKNPDQTRDAFDEEGFYKIGDAGRLADPNDPAKGIVFDGRVAEDFKLTTGTWVHVGGIRVAAIAAASPLVQDCVVAGHDRDFIGLLVWPNVAACRELCKATADAPLDGLLRHPALLARVRECLASYNAAQPGSSTRVARALLMAEPPSPDANEITDKGYINQRATLERRKALVMALYATPPGPEVIVV